MVVGGIVCKIKFNNNRMIQNLKYRLFTNWTFARVMYLSLGLLMIAMSWNNSQWWLTLFGAYYAAMGLLGFGCAGGSCVRKI
jgi:hypothetical protein